MNYNLERFKKGQETSYDLALREIRNGRKESHWIWYIFPQMRGLGSSNMSNYYGISGLDEAKAYLEDPVLRSRLVEISEALMDLEVKDAARIFGYPDTIKVRSCMTLFEAASGVQNSVFTRVLNAYYHGERCMQTLQMLGLCSLDGI